MRITAQTLMLPSAHHRASAGCRAPCAAFCSSVAGSGMGTAHTDVLHTHHALTCLAARCWSHVQHASHTGSVAMTICLLLFLHSRAPTHSDVLPTQARLNVAKSPVEAGTHSGLCTSCNRALCTLCALCNRGHLCC